MKTKACSPVSGSLPRRALLHQAALGVLGGLAGAVPARGLQAVSGGGEKAPDIKVPLPPGKEGLNRPSQFIGQSNLLGS
jgi:hypothetical protein